MFQEIINTYGVPSYKEINPAVYTIVTFPFLFGVMFGDIGHGATLLFVSLLLVLFGESISNWMPSIKEFLRYRYILLMMGFFATFCGFMYNDFMAMPLYLFDSCYNFTTGERKDPYCVYPMGVDPVWSISTNELTFTNSMKMKIAVILGVGHMTLGIF